MGYKYIIEFIDGDSNVWADLLTRWAAPKAASQDIKIKSLRWRSHLNLLTTSEFKWPSIETIQDYQVQSQTLVPEHAIQDVETLLWHLNGKIWIPALLLNIDFCI